MDDQNTNNPDGDELSGGLPVVAGTSRGTAQPPPQVRTTNRYTRIPTHHVRMITSTNGEPFTGLPTSFVEELNETEGNSILFVESESVEKSEDKPEAEGENGAADIGVGAVDFLWPQNKPHPLLIPDVMRDILSHLECQDLERCRNVCRVWNEESCSILQQKKIVALYEMDSVKYYLEKMGDTTWFPHHCFEVHVENLTEQIVMKRFWDTFGSHIKSLDLRQGSIYIETLFDVINQYLPNLEKLSIKSLPRKAIRIRYRNNNDQDHPRTMPLANLLGGPFPVGMAMGLVGEANRGGERGERGERGARVRGRERPGPDRDQDQDRDRRDREHRLGMGMVLSHLREPRPDPVPPPPQINVNDMRFPQIREVTLCWCSENDDSSLLILKDIFRSIPSLERLFVIDIPTATTVNIQGAGAIQNPAVGNRARIARLLLKVMTDSTITLSQLNNIDFPLEPENNDLIVLTEKGYNFPNMTLKLGSGCKSAALKDLLTNMSGALHKLNITFHDGFFNGGIIFPAYSQMRHPEDTMHLREVRVLTLNKYHGVVNHFQNLRNLKTLTVNSARVSTSFGDLTFEGQEHQLRGFKTDSHLSPATILSVSSTFPLLRVIKVSQLDDHGIGNIYRNLPYITELEIINGKVTDQGLTGVPLEVCKDMAETATFHFVDPAKFRYDLFLGSLQYLTTLKLSGEEVTDISIVFGIVDCKNLESLTLHSPAFTDVGLYKIADRMSHRLKFLDIHECENVSESGKYYLKEKIRSDSDIILDTFAMKQRAAAAAKVENLWRQVGFPFRTRRLENSGLATRPERFMANDGNDFAHFPIRERMLLHMDRRRRLLSLRMLEQQRRRAGRGQAGAGAAAIAAAPPVVLPVVDVEEMRRRLQGNQEWMQEDDDDIDYRMMMDLNEAEGQDQDQGEDMQFPDDMFDVVRPPPDFNRRRVHRRVNRAVAMDDDELLVRAVQDHYSDSDEDLASPPNERNEEGEGEQEFHDAEDMDGLVIVPPVADAAVAPMVLEVQLPLAPQGELEFEFRNVFNNEEGEPEPDADLFFQFLDVEREREDAMQDGGNIPPQ